MTGERVKGRMVHIKILMLKGSSDNSRLSSPKCIMEKIEVQRG